MDSEYSEFLACLFGTQSTQEPIWALDELFRTCFSDKEQSVRHATRVFLEIDSLSDAYSDLQIVNGLTCLADSSLSDFPYFFFLPDIPAEARSDAIGAMLNVFESLFSRKCGDICSFDADELSGMGELCYIWWDVLPRHGLPYQHFNELVDKKVIEVLTNLLGLKSDACKESALHGLGHWQPAYPDEVAEIIKQNLTELPERLWPYANSAKLGRVQ